MMLLMKERCIKKLGYTVKEKETMFQIISPEGKIILEIIKLEGFFHVQTWNEETDGLLVVVCVIGGRIVAVCQKRDKSTKWIWAF